MPVVSFSYARGRRPASVSLLSADGKAALTVRLGRDGHGDVPSRRSMRVTSLRSLYMCSVTMPFASVTLSGAFKVL